MGRAIFVVPKNGSCLLLCLSGFWSSEQYGFLPKQKKFAPEQKNIWRERMGWTP
jgi:hypothetical protein